MKPSEKIAEKLLRQLFPEMELMYADTGQNSGEADFKLMDRKTQKLRAVVEVTTTTIEENKKTSEIVKNNNVIESTKLKRLWHLFVSEDFCRISRLSKKLRKLESYLLPIEKSGIKEFDAFRDGIDNSDILKIHEEMKIEAGFSHEARKPRILLSPPGSGGKMSYSHIQETVEKIAYKPDNLNKLRKVSDAEKHLFVIVDDETDSLTWNLMLKGNSPPAPPCLPTEINFVWLATWSLNGSYLIWRVSLTKGWEVLGEFSAR